MVGFAEPDLARVVRRCDEPHVEAGKGAHAPRAVDTMDKDRTHALRGTAAIDEKLLEQLAYNEKMAELGRLSVGVIHELITPLSVIVSASQMILREKDLSPFVSEMVERIGVEAQRLSQLTRGITSFSRKEEDSSSDTDVSHCLAEVAMLLKYEIQKRSILLWQDFVHDAPSMAVNGNRLKQVFINLIMNALQAMEQGGRLRLATRFDGCGLTVTIEDTGTGIPQEKLEEVFKPFYTTKAAGEGTGLGLFVTKNIVEEMGGTIDVASAVGSGTVFTLLLPVGLARN